MNSSNQPEQGHKNLALWITTIVEALMIVVMGAYNIYEVRRNSELVQSKIRGLSEYSARQGEKIDRMTTAIELYVGKKFAVKEEDSTKQPAADKKIERAIELLETLKKKDAQAQQDGPPGENQPIRSK